jgi:pyruvate/2-oxoacid:ferredoxin oxidoreductase alpha subunit
MTFTSSPGFSLMLEGISYMIGSEVPAVFVNIMRGGPGLGNIGPEQADIKLVCRGLGHGNTHAIVLAPSTPQEMLDLAMLSFELAFKYRNPVVIVGDGYLGQMTGKVRLPREMVVPGVPEWAVFGDRSHRGNLICSINLSEVDLERHNIHLNEKYEEMAQQEQRADVYRCEDADVVLVACNTPAQLAKGAIKDLRDKGLNVGLFRPITLWPFPIDALRDLLDRVERLVVVEASSGQLEDELRLALSHADVHAPPPMSHVRRMGGILPSQDEIVEHVLSLQEVR